MAESQPARGRDQEAADAHDVIATLVELTRTGPLALGTFTTAQILAVNGPAPGLPVPEPAVLAEAVRGLVARGMAVPVADSDEIDVQGDLGLVLTIQHRSRLLIDVVFRGRGEDRSWHLVLLPQPEGVTLVGTIDPLGLHHLTMHVTGDAVARLEKELPRGKAAAVADDRPIEDQVRRADESALVSVVRFSDSAAISSTDLALLRAGDTLRVLRRRADDAQVWDDLRLDHAGALAAIAELAAPLLAEPGD